MQTRKLKPGYAVPEAFSAALRRNPKWWFPFLFCPSIAGTPALKRAVLREILTIALAPLDGVVRHRYVVGGVERYAIFGLQASTTHYLPLTTYHVLLTAYYLPLTTYYLLLTTYHHCYPPSHPSPPHPSPPPKHRILSLMVRARWSLLSFAKMGCHAARGVCSQQVCSGRRWISNCEMDPHPASLCITLHRTK